MVWSARRISCFLLHSTGKIQPHGHNLIARETWAYTLLHVQKKEMGSVVSSQSLAQATVFGVQSRARLLGSIHLLTSSTEEDNSRFFLCL